MPEKTKLFHKVSSFLASDGLDFDQSSNEEFIRFVIDKKWGFTLQFLEQMDVFVIYSRMPVVVPEDRIEKVGELINRINHQLLLGNFEMDYQRGVVHLKIPVIANTIVLQSDSVQELIRCSIDLLDLALPFFARVVEGNEHPMLVSLEFSF